MNCDEEHIMCVCPVLMWFVSVSDLLYKACGFSRSMHMHASKPAHRQRCECVMHVALAVASDLFIGYAVLIRSIH